MCSRLFCSRIATALLNPTYKRADATRLCRIGALHCYKEG